MNFNSYLGCCQPALGLQNPAKCSDMSERALHILADNMNRLIRRDGGVFSSNDAAQIASQGMVSRSTFDRFRNLGKVGATAPGVDKLEGVAKTLGVEVWQLFVPNLDVRHPPRLATESEHAHERQQWPFDLVDVQKLEKLTGTDRARLEAALILTAAQLGLDIQKRVAPKEE